MDRSNCKEGGNPQRVYENREKRVGAGQMAVEGLRTWRSEYQGKDTGYFRTIK